MELHNTGSSVVPVKILLVDDHADTRKVLSLNLHHRGYEVTAVAGKAAAFAICRDHSFELLIDDIRRADGSGYDLMRELAKTCNIRGIALTGYGHAEDIPNAYAAGYSAHLLKPTHADRICQTIESAPNNTELIA